MEKSNTLSVLILAAGMSNRLGKAKQLLRFDDESLLQIAIKKALLFSSDITVILGARSDECEKEIKNLNVKSYVNTEYKKGMGNSLSFGISKLKYAKKVLVMLCDMPLIPMFHFERMIEISNENQDLLICSKYQNKLAVPSIFPNKYFELLENLDGEKGAKKILEKNNSKFVKLEDKYSIDIDTKEDYKKLLKVFIS